MAPFYPVLNELVYCMDAVQQSAAAYAHAAQPQRRRTSDRCDGLSGDGMSRGRASEGYGKPGHQAADPGDGGAIREARVEVRDGEEEGGRVRSTRMAIKCSACSREVSDKVATCPGCGAPLTPIPDSVRFTRKGRKWDGIGFALVLLGIVIGMVSNVALGWAVAFAGLAVFIVGRSK